MMMKKAKYLAMIAVLLLSMSACTNGTDNPTVPSQQEMEKNLVGLWYETFDYEDVTESGKPFNRALIAVEASSETTKEAGITNHETSAITFFLRIIEWIRANY